LNKHIQNNKGKKKFKQTVQQKKISRPINHADIVPEATVALHIEHHQKV